MHPPPPSLPVCVCTTRSGGSGGGGIRAVVPELLAGCRGAGTGYCGCCDHAPQPLPALWTGAGEWDTRAVYNEHCNHVTVMCCHSETCSVHV